MRIKTLLFLVGALVYTGSTSVAAPPDKDEAIAIRAQRAIAESGIVDSAGIVVAVVNGEAEVRGTVRSQHIKDEVERIAGRTKGVTAIRNSLLVQRPDASGDDDQILANRVRSALLAAGIPHVDRISVQSFNGSISLIGSADTGEIRDDASRVAGETRGVTAVRNELVVPDP